MRRGKGAARNAVAVLMAFAICVLTPSAALAHPASADEKVTVAVTDEAMAINAAAGNVAIGGETSGKLFEGNTVFGGKVVDEVGPDQGQMSKFVVDYTKDSDEWIGSDRTFTFHVVDVEAFATFPLPDELDFDGLSEADFHARFPGAVIEGDSTGYVDADVRFRDITYYFRGDIVSRSYDASTGIGTIVVREGSFRLDYDLRWHNVYIWEDVANDELGPYYDVSYSGDGSAVKFLDHDAWLLNVNLSSRSEASGYSGMDRIFAVYNSVLPRTKFRFMKTGSTGVGLKGGQFNLETEDGTVLASAESGEDGYVLFDKWLPEGTYYVRETEAPPGYNKVAVRYPVKVTGEWYEADGGYRLRARADMYDPDDTDFSNPIVMLINHTGFELPSSGGPGTCAFYLAGMACVCAAVLAFVRRRRGKEAVMMVKRLFSLVLTAMLAVCLMAPSGVMAAGVEPPVELPSDQDSKCSLTVIFAPGDTPVPNVNFKLFKIADVDFDTMTYQPLEGYDYGVLEGTAEWAEKAQILAEYVVHDQQTPISSQTTDKNGTVCFPDLDPGIYLVLGATGVVGNTKYTPTPSFITLPGFDKSTSKWSRMDMSVNIKSYLSGTVSNPPVVDPDTKITRHVLKVWEGDENYRDVRPEQVVVDLLQDGEPYKTVVLSAANNWRYTWEDLPSGHEYVPVEREGGENYRASVTQEGNTITITNTYVPGPEGSDPGPGSSPRPSPGPEPDGPGELEIPDAPYPLRRSSEAVPKAASEPVVDSSGKFGFDVVLTAANGAALAETYLILKPPGTVIGKVVDGKGSFRLNAGETFLIPGMPEGTSYKVTEQETPGWDTSGKYNDEGTVGGEAVTFVNKEVADPGGLELPKTGGMGIAPYVVLGSAAVLLSALLLLCRKRYR